MKQRETRQSDIVERYLQGKLTADEEQAFEEAYLADPELLDEVELVERLREGLRRHGAAVPPGPVRAPLRRWPAVLASPRYAAAASVLLLVSLASSAVLLVQNAELRSGAPAAAGSAARVLPLVNVRGNAGVNVVPPPSGGQITVFMIDPGFTDYDRYRAILTRADRPSNEPLLAIDGLQRTYEDFVAFSVPASLLAPGDYEIALLGRMLDWPEGRDPDPISRTRVTIPPPEK